MRSLLSWNHLQQASCSSVDALRGRVDALRGCVDALRGRVDALRGCVELGIYYSHLIKIIRYLIKIVQIL